MKAFMRNMFVFSALLVFFVTSGCGARSQEVSSSEGGASASNVTNPSSSSKDGGASASNVTDPSSPGKAGDRMEIEIKGVKVAFRWCPPGSFTRHFNESTKDYWDKPQKTFDDDPDGYQDFEITLTQGFWLAETETTQELWYAVTGKNPSSGQRTRKTPVNFVTWDDTQDFISQLNSAGYAPSGYEFRLPTEAQWEYACMAGSTGERYGKIDAIAWYGGYNENDEYVGNSDGHAHEVGQKKANAWGLYDMLGNVWEQCSDWYGDYPMKNLTDYTGPVDGSYRVLRGGGWSRGAGSCGRSCRGNWYGRYYYPGFRLALVPKER